MEADCLTLSVENTLAGLQAAIDALSDHLESRRVAPALVHVAQTVADELISNVIRHGCPDNGRHTIELELVVGRDEVTLHVFDDGVAFDPFAHPPPDLSVPVEDRPIGGLGIHLVRELSSSHSYERIGGRNHVTVTLRNR